MVACIYKISFRWKYLLKGNFPFKWKVIRCSHLRYSHISWILTFQKICVIFFIESPLSDEKCFLFYPKSSFYSQIIYVFVMSL